MKKQHSQENSSGRGEGGRALRGGAPVSAPLGDAALGVAVRFIVITAVLVAFSLAPVYQTALNGYAVATAHSAAWVTSLLGERAHVVGGTSVWSPRFSVTVVEGCCAAECAWFLIAGILAMPASLLARLTGVILGASLIAVLNVLRVASLFWIGIRAHNVFRVVHEDAWPMILVLATLLFVAAWLDLMRNPRFDLAARRQSLPDAAV